MNTFEIIILIASIALVTFTVIFNVLRRKKCKACSNQCSGGCCSCPYSENCNSDKSETKK